MNTSFEIITQYSRLEKVVSEISNSKIIGLDTESDGRFCYPEQLCLIQIATEHQIYLIDTIQIHDFTSLERILSDVDIVKVIHESTYDIQCLDRCRLRVFNIFDTAIAARYVGIKKFGLAGAIQNVLKIAFEKNTHLQKSDWGKRPLSKPALEYAANDVRHLTHLRFGLIEQLTSLKRMDWVTEECDRLGDIRYQPLDMENSFLNVKNARKLNPVSLAILKALHKYREEVAMRVHRPPYFIFPDDILVYLANNPDTDLASVPGLGKRCQTSHGHRLRQAIKEGLASPPIILNTNTKEVESEDTLKILEEVHEKRDELYSRLRDWRAKLGASLSLDPSLLWPSTSLRRIAKDLRSFEIELLSDEIRMWQKEQFADSFRRQLNTLCVC